MAAHRLAFLVALARDAGEHAAQRHFGALGEAFQIAGVVRRQFGDLVL
jgi:hypothetical protein